VITMDILPTLNSVDARETSYKSLQVESLGLFFLYIYIYLYPRIILVDVKDIVLLFKIFPYRLPSEK